MTNPTIATAENISLLALLHSVPALPSSNPIVCQRTQQHGYSLSFDRERSLASVVAFLTRITDNPNHIAAVCVEEKPDTACLNVLLAVNQACETDANQLLQSLEQGFGRIFKTLSHVEDERAGTAHVEDEVFASIISMCSARILCRLGLAANRRNTPKQSVKTLLQDAVPFLAQAGPDAKPIVARAKEVVKLVDSWAKYQTATRLSDLIDGVYRLSRAGDLRAALSSISNRFMDPSCRRSLLNIVRKTARYREAARFLFRTAKRSALVRQMRVLVVNGPPETFHQSTPQQYHPDLASKISQISARGGQPWQLQHVCQLLGVDLAEANNLFVQQTRKTLREAKIHAEIQLLLCHELRSSKLPPRVVCSSKDACFLCNAFILMHGKMHTPHCHGRLYPGWRLPASLPAGLQAEFNGVLEQQIRQSLMLLDSRRKRTLYPYPEESAFLTVLASTSTLRSAARHESAMNGDSEVTRQQRPSDVVPGNDTLAANSDPRSALPSLPPDSFRAAEVASTVATDGAMSAPSSMPQAASRRSPSREPRYRHDQLVQGQALSNRVKADQTSPLYSAGPLEIEIEYSPRLSAGTSAARRSELQYSIEWLTPAAAATLQEHSAVPIIDVESLDGEVKHSLDGQGRLHIAAKQSILRFTISGPNDGHV